MTSRYDSIFEREAGKHGGVEARTLKAIAIVESGLDETAYRHARQEQRFYERYIKDKPKWVGHRYYDQPRVIAASYGLMQVMYTTATWVGFPAEGDWWLLFRPETNIEIGARYYARKLNQYGVVEHALAAYNAGAMVLREDGRPANAWYVDKVMAEMARLPAPAPASEPASEPR